MILHITAIGHGEDDADLKEDREDPLECGYSDIEAPVFPATDKSDICSSFAKEYPTYPSHPFLCADHGKEGEEDKGEEGY